MKPITPIYALLITLFFLLVSVCSCTMQTGAMKGEDATDDYYEGPSSKDVLDHIPNPFDPDNWESGTWVVTDDPFTEGPTYSGAGPLTIKGCDAMEAFRTKNRSCRDTCKQRHKKELDVQSLCVNTCMYPTYTLVWEKYLKKIQATHSGVSKYAADNNRCSRDCLNPPGNSLLKSQKCYSACMTTAGY